MTRKIKSLAALEQFLTDVEAGREERPDWVECRGDCRLDKLEPDALEETVRRLHGAVLRGFKAKNVQLKSAKRRISFWRAVARNGFHDFSEQGWRKPYDSPFIHDYDYIGAYQKGGLEAVDAYAAYGSVLGTHDFSVEDFVETELCSQVRTIVEPMAGSAEFAYLGHFRYPDFRYLMFDLDEHAAERVLAYPWREETDKSYWIGNVLDEETWKQVKSQSTGESLAYIGKQSHHYLNAAELKRLLDLGTRYSDYFMLEVPEPSLVSDLDAEEDLSRDEMEDAGFHIGLVDHANTAPNPLTNALSFTLDLWDDEGRRTLFDYGGWTSWQPPTLVAFANLLGIHVYYFHGDEEQFWSVDEAADAPASAENVSFMIFTRRALSQDVLDT